MTRMVEVQCAAAPKCEQIVVIPEDADPKPYMDAAGWSIILAFEEVHFACCDEHALDWVDANANRLFKNTPDVGRQS